VPAHEQREVLVLQPPTRDEVVLHCCVDVDQPAL
jgi:hypothetical protein